jgi:hypothetical protein
MLNFEGRKKFNISITKAFFDWAPFENLRVCDRAGERKNERGYLSQRKKRQLSLSANADFSIRGYNEATLPAFNLFGLENCLNSPQKSITAWVTQSYQKKAFMTPRGISSNV